MVTKIQEFSPLEIAVGEYDMQRDGDLSHEKALEHAAKFLSKQANISIQMATTMIEKELKLDAQVYHLFELN